MLAMAIMAAALSCTPIPAGGTVHMEPGGAILSHRLLANRTKIAPVILPAPLPAAPRLVSILLINSTGIG